LRGSVGITNQNYGIPSETKEDSSTPSELNTIPSESKEAVLGFLYEPYGL